MAVDYRMLTYRGEDGRPTAGILVDGRVHDAARVLAPSGIDAGSVLRLLEQWDATRATLPEAIPRLVASAGIALEECRLLAPILYPPAIVSIWGNYLDHNAEMAALAGREPPVADPDEEPFFVQKTSAHSVVGPYAPIRMPSFTRQLDYEAELGVVIGRAVRDATEDEARDAIAGYVILNDLSARDQMKRAGGRTAHLMDWFATKSFTDSAPMGPWLTPAEALPDTSNLRIRLWVNGTLKQNGSTASMVYAIPRVVAALSRRLGVLPGDVIATGCPAGVGMARGEFLQPGDEIRIEIDGCGTLVNTVVAATAA